MTSPVASSIRVTVPDVPLACWSAETRTTSAGHVLGPDARISRAAAFAGYTLGGAHALRRPDVGALEVGRLADLVVLDADPFAVDTDRLPDLVVLETWVGGRRAWTYDRGLL